MTNRDVTGNTANCSFYVSAAPSRRLPIPLKAPAGMPPGWGFLLQGVELQSSLGSASENFLSSRAFAFDGVVSFSKDGRAEIHSAVDYRAANLAFCASSTYRR